MPRILATLAFLIGVPCCQRRFSTRRRRISTLAVIVALTGLAPATATAQGIDDAFINALTAGPGVRESIAFVQSHNRDDLIEAGMVYCGGLVLGEGSIESAHDLLSDYGFTGHEAVAVAHAAREVYCPNA